MWKWMFAREPGGSSSSEVQGDILNLCEHSARSSANLAFGGNLLNRRQCLDLATKLSRTTSNVRELVDKSGAPADIFRPALERLLRNLEKAKRLVSNCGDEDWCAAAVFQSQNENAFREIVLEAGLCYHVVYELAKSKSKDWDDLPEGLRQSSVFMPASQSDVHEDQQELMKRLDELANGYESWNLFDRGRVAREQSLARYLLAKMYWASLATQVSVLDEHSPILWQTVSEPPETWGKSRYLGSGLGASGVVSTTWLGIPCARKEFHGGDGFSFFTEAHILAMLKHPRIVSFFCYGSGLERTDRFIALELMEMSLYDLIQKQKHKDEHFSLPVAVDMMAQIACGMCYLHGQGVAHRDLKPHNIVVSSPFPHLLDYFDVKLIDFGISKRKVKSSDAYTMSYRGIGTSQYRAPELHPRAQPDGKKSKVLWFKADAFSFAMTCMHILTLRAPFIDLSPSELYFAQCMDGRRPEFPIDCPMELVALIRDCWNIDPCVRPSFIEICIRLEAFYHRILSWSSIPDKDGTNDEDIRFKLEELCNIQRSPNSNTYDKVEDVMGQLEDEADKLDNVQKKEKVANELGKLVGNESKGPGDKLEDVVDKPKNAGDELKDSLESKSNEKKEDSKNAGDELKDSLESKSNEKKEDFDKMHFYLNLSYLDVQIISNLVNGDSLLNKRQCQDLSCKLSKTVQNVKRLVSHCGTLAGFLCHAMEIFYRHVEEAKLLVENCCNKDLCIDSIFQIQNLFCPMVKMLYQQVEKGKLLVESRRSRVLCAKFIFQVQNENSFQEILLDVSLCYNAIYEQAKSTCLKWGTLPEDLCQYDVLIPASNSNVHQDQQEIKKRLEDIVDPHFCFGPLNSYFVLPQTLHINQCLARYLLLKLNFISQGSQSKLLNGSSAIFWKKDTEPFETWGSDKFGGKGAGASGVYITNFLSIPCAKKIFDEGFEKTFLKEMGILIHLNHPRIVNFICCGNDQGPGNRFIALELMNKSLSTLIKEQNEVPFSLPVVLDIIVQMARGMRYLHDQKIAHRDLKPDNVMVNTLIFPHLPIHFNVKLIDFGVSKAKIEVSSAITVTAVGIGTSKYRAPELHPKRPLELERKACWFKADVYCFAMTCIHLLTLKMPFDDIDNMGSEAAYMALQNGRRPEPPKECPKELAALLRMCWHIDPSRRPSFIEICSELEAIRFKGPSKLSTFDQRKDSLGGRKIELMGQNYIDLKLQGSSLIPKGNKKEKIPDVMPEVNSNDAISVSSCAFGHTLQFLPESRCDSTTQFICGFCQNQGYGEIYHCQTCKSDIHTACAENKDVVKVFFHEDPLHLLIQNHSLGDSDAICGFCDESLEANSEWVYRCELCKYDVHALCTKYSRKIIHSTHPHELTLVRYAVRKRLVSNQSLFCKGCKGDLKGYYYTCSKKSCDYNLHPFCAILPTSLPCLFDSSHRLSLDTEPRPFQPFQPFQCGKCATSGNSWLYHCDQCLTDIHLECIEDMKEEELIDDWEKLYDESMAGYYNKDAAAKVIIFSKLLDRLLGNQTETQDLEARTQATPSSSRPQPVTRRTKAQMPTLSETHPLGAVDIFDDHEKHAADLTAERRAKKMAAKLARQEKKARLKEDQGAKLDNMEKLLQDLQSSEILSETVAKALTEKMQNFRVVFSTLLATRITQAHMKTRRVPHIVLLSELQANMTHKLLTSSQLTGTREVQLHLLCEEPNHEHVVPSNSLSCAVDQDTEELWQRLQPLLATGLQAVAKAINVLGERDGTESIFPNIDVWDIGEFVQEEGMVEAVEMAHTEESAAVQWLSSYLEEKGMSIFAVFGLLRIRYKETERGISPRYRQGSLAWLCNDHLKRGLEAGILEPYPLRVYHNPKHDQQQQALN